MSRPLTTLNARLLRWRRYRETLRELESLSNRELTDIGIRRGDIRRHARAASML